MARGTSKSGVISNLKRREEHIKEKDPLWAVLGSIKKLNGWGQNILSPIELNLHDIILKAQHEDIIDIEIQANICSFHKYKLSYGDTSEGERGYDHSIESKRRTVEGKPITRRSQRICRHADGRTGRELVKRKGIYELKGTQGNSE